MDDGEHQNPLSGEADGPPWARGAGETEPAEDRIAIREDLREEEALHTEIVELQREAEELEEARRRRALSADKGPPPRADLLEESPSEPMT